MTFFVVIFVIESNTLKKEMEEKINLCAMGVLP